MADYEVTIVDGLGSSDYLSEGTEWRAPVDLLGITDSVTGTAIYSVTITDRLSLIDSRDVNHGRRYPRRGRKQHGATPATSVPRRSRLLGGR